MTKVFWKPHPKQAQALSADASELLYGGARGGGKLLPMDAKVLTPKGWVLNGELKVGDTITDPATGGTTKILRVFDKKNQPIYRITFDDGATCRAGAEHLWAYKKPNHLRPKTKKSSQREFVKNVLGRNTETDRFHNLRVGDTMELKESLEKGFAPRIPLTEPVLFTVNGRTDFDPYLCGLYLGDGSYSGYSITTADEEIVNYIVKEHGYRHGGKYHYYPDKTHPSYVKIQKWVHNHGLAKKRAWEKFVPKYVFTANIEYKVAFLQGLMDSDGTVDKRGHVSFCTTSEELARNVQELVWSLGGKATVSKKENPKYTYKGENKTGRTAYIVYIYSDFASELFRLSRKKERCTNRWNGGYENMRKVVSIEYESHEDARCILLDSIYHLYITDDYIVTHNTDAGLVWMIEPKYVQNPKYRGLVIRRYSKDLSDWVDRARQMYRPLGGKVVGNPPEVRFPSGAIIKTGHLNDDSAYEQYQGHEYQKILFEELTKIPREAQYEKLIGSNRSTIPGLKAKVFATTNPDGPGSEWVKKRWKTDSEKHTLRRIRDPFNPEHERTLLYVPSTVYDNPTLVENDPAYLSMLHSIQDPLLKRQWLDGSWESPEIEGSYYLTYIRSMYDWHQPELPPLLTLDPNKPDTRPKPPAIAPRIFDFEINLNAPVDTWWDIGVHDKTAIWFTQTVGHNQYVIDYYEASNEGLEHFANVLKEKPYKYFEHFAPHDIEVREWGSGASRLEQAKKYGILFRKVPKLSVEDGIEAVRQIFKHTYFHLTNTENGVYLLQNYRKQFDEKRQIFSDKPYHDHTSHAADAFRYMAVGYFRYKKPKEYKQPVSTPNYSYNTQRYAGNNSNIRR